MSLVSIPVDIRDRMIELCDKVNTAPNPSERAKAEERLAGFREAADMRWPDAYGTMLMDCDCTAMEKYPDEEYICCGVLNEPRYKEAE